MKKVFLPFNLSLAVDATLLGAARVLAGMRDELAGNVLFIFQPAEEGAPDGEERGAALMLKEGLQKQDIHKSKSRPEHPVVPLAGCREYRMKGT